MVLAVPIATLRLMGGGVRRRFGLDPQVAIDNALAALTSPPVDALDMASRVLARCENPEGLNPNDLIIATHSTLPILGSH